MSNTPEELAPEPCEQCGATEEVEFIEDPYQSEIHHDNTMHWLCRSCYKLLAMEI